MSMFSSERGIGGSAFNHSQSQSAEREYDRLRDLARSEHSKQQQAFDRSRAAYDAGDGAGAHALSEEGKRHKAQAAQYNKQASEFIFRENNAEGRVDGDTIDLHGQFVEEAEDILEERIKYATSTGQTHLHVIVGKGNHSVNHVQKLKPRVEQVCRELGLQYHTEPNAGRLYVNLTGGPAEPGHPGGYGGKPQHGGQQHGGYQQHHGGQQHGGQQHGGQPGYPGGQQQQHGQPQEGFQYEEEVRKAVPILKKIFKSCCTVM